MIHFYFILILYKILPNEFEAKIFIKKNSLYFLKISVS